MENPKIPQTEAIPLPPDSLPSEFPVKKNNLRKIALIVGGLLLLSVVGVSAYYVGTQRVAQLMPIDETQEASIPVPLAESEGTMCTMDVMICPDGSSIGRSGPNCEFTPCPSDSPSNTPTITTEEIVIPSNWTTNTVSSMRISLRLPSNYKFFGSNADVIIQEQDVQNIPDQLVLVDAVFNTYDGSSRREFYSKYLNGEFDWYKVGVKPNILSITEHQLSSNSYLKFVIKNDYGNSNEVHYLTVRNGKLIAFSGAENKESFLQQNIAKVLDTVEVSK